MAALGFDHAGFIVPDLARSHACLAALGFTLTSRADHTMTDAQGRTVPAGSSQHSVMFERGYLELMEITDPSAGHQLASAIQTRYGLHILALSTPDAAATHARYEQQGQRVGALRHWARPIRELDRQGLARFAFFDSPWHKLDPAYICWVQHLTPELIRSDRDVQHANTALAISAVHYAGPAPAAGAWADRLEHLGLPATRQAGGQTTLAMGDDRLEVHSRADLHSVLPVRMDLVFQTLAPLRLHCQAAGVAHRMLQPGVMEVDLQSELGLMLVGIEATAI